jgi:glycerol-3-phosphate acyltransferase PlsY
MIEIIAVAVVWLVGSFLIGLLLGKIMKGN